MTMSKLTLPSLMGCFLDAIPGFELLALSQVHKSALEFRLPIITIVAIITHGALR